MLTRRKFFKATSGLLVPAICGIAKAQIPMLPYAAGPSGPNTNSLLYNLMAYWKLDDAIAGPMTDATGNGLSLAVVNPDAGLTSVAGVLGNAVNSIGGGGGRYLWTADTAALAAGTGQSFSVSTWCYNNSPAYPGTFVSKCDNIVDVPAGNGEFRLYSVTTDTGQLHWFVWQSDGTMHDVGSPAVSGVAGAFNHYVLTFDATSNTAKSYANGVFKTSIVIASNVLRTAFPFNLLNANNSFRNAGGKVDETGYWHQALSATLVTRLYNGGAALPFSSFT